MSQDKDFLPDLSGKCVSINIIDNTASHDLNNPRFEYQGGRLFIIGTVPKGATVSDWSSGRESVIAWERVTDYFVFKDLDDYYRAIKKSDESEE